MSSFRAIAAVSQTLLNLLEDRMEVIPQQPVKVTIAPPDVTLSAITDHRINLYLYQVAENGSLKNQDLPRPPLALNLHYLVTAYAANEGVEQADLVAQQILGNAMRVLHDFAIISPGLRAKDDATTSLLDPVLLGETERIKITLQPASLDELSKIWTSLPQSHFRRSVAYEVSVVQIDSATPRGPALPVKTRRVHVTTSRRPEIKAVYRTPALGEPKGDPRVRLLEEITIEGSGFAANDTWVRLGRLQPIRVTPDADGVLRITVPDDQYPPGHPTPDIAEQDLLQPGAQTVEVLVERPMERVEGGLDRGTTGTTPQILTSNQAVFLLVPQVSSADLIQAPNVDLLTVAGKRLFREGSKSSVLLGDAAVVVRRPEGEEPWADPTATSVQVPLVPLAAELTPGQTYPVRVLVNGAQSLEEGVTFTLAP